MLQDPPCLLTASRDRSVKLRALPTNDHQPNDSKPTALERTATTSEQTGQEEQAKQDILDEPNNSNNGDDSEASTLRPPPRGNSEEQEPISDTAEPPKPRRRNNSSRNSTVSMPSSKSTKSKTPAKIPVLGYDLCTLTLGRIADGFRRDTYSFPVDLKGRGEGRAVEARAVLQVGRARADVLAVDRLLRPRGRVLQLPSNARPTQTFPLRETWISRTHV